MIFIRLLLTYFANRGRLRVQGDSLNSESTSQYNEIREGEGKCT